MRVTRRYASLTGVTYVFSSHEIIAALAEKYEIPLDGRTPALLTVDDDPLQSATLDVRYEVEVPRDPKETGDRT